MSNLLKIIFGLVILLLTLFVADLFVIDDFWLTDYIRGSFTETLGIIITLIFVERIFSAQQKKDEKNEEIKQIQRFNKIISVELDKCIQYASFMTQKAGEQDYIVKKDFDFNRLEIFHIQSLNIFDGEKAYRLFGKSIENIVIVIREILLNCSFKYFDNLEKLLLEYLDFIKIGTPFGFLEILEYNESTKKMMSRMIKNIPNGKVPFYEEYPHNMMRSFIRLYHVINFHIDFIERYKKEISLINNQNQK
jgi:hypothetical protein